MAVENYIDHVGFISAIRKGIAYVTLIQTSACASCSVKGSCGVGDSEKKHFEIPVSEGQWHVGEEVNVSLNTSAGFFALFLGYILPFVLVVVSLVIFITMGMREAMAGAMALTFLLPYYALIALLRKYLSHKLNLKITRR